MKGTIGPGGGGGWGGGRGVVKGEYASGTCTSPGELQELTDGMARVQGF